MAHHAVYKADWLHGPTKAHLGSWKKKGAEKESIQVAQWLPVVRWFQILSSYGYNYHIPNTLIQL